MKIISFLALAGLLIIVFYEISLPLEFARMETIQIPDPDAEAAYDRCYAEKDREMHEAVFGAIDNPDVQKEMISTNRDRIASDCRQLHPERMTTIERELESNLIVLMPRFW